MRTWAQNHPPGVHSPIRRLSQAIPVICPRASEATSEPYVRSRVGAFWLDGHASTRECSPLNGQPTQKLQLCLARTGGFPASWTEHRFCLRQATIWAVDSRRWFCVKILIAHSSHNRESAPQWGIEPGQIRRGICCCFKNALRDDETQWTNPQNTPIL